MKKIVVVLSVVLLAAACSSETDTTTPTPTTTPQQTKTEPSFDGQPSDFLNATFNVRCPGIIGGGAYPHLASFVDGDEIGTIFGDYGSMTATILDQIELVEQSPGLETVIKVSCWGGGSGTSSELQIFSANPDEPTRLGSIIHHDQYQYAVDAQEGQQGSFVTLETDWAPEDPDYDPTIRRTYDVHWNGEDWDKTLLEEWTETTAEEASCASSTTASELPGSIIYQVWDRETNNTDIYAMNPDGTNIRSLANSEDKELLSDAGSISPDGESILFLKVEDIDDPDFEYAKSVNIFIMNSDGTNQRQLTNFGRQVTAQSPIWSPDGQHIFYEVFLAADIHISIMDTEGNGLSYDLPEEKEQTNAYLEGWYVEGQVAVYTFDRFDETENGFYLTNSGGTQFTETPERANFFEDGEWSPDGQHFVFVMDENPDEDGGKEIYVVNTSDMGTDQFTNIRQLTDNTWNDSSPTWSPDSQHIAFVSDCGQELGNNAIFVTDVEGSDTFFTGQNGSTVDWGN